MLLLMLLPALLGLVIVIASRRTAARSEKISIRGIWLLAPLLVATVAADAARGSTDHDPAVNRIEGALVLAMSVLFVVLNVRAVRDRLTALAVLGTGVGGAMNAAAALVFGGMPALRASARIAGYDYGPDSTPPSDYVFSDHRGLGAILMGDFIPIPGFLKVLSIGDLLLFPGLAALVVVTVLNLKVAGRPSDTAFATHAPAPGRAS
jgi:hypothetical protein